MLNPFFIQGTSNEQGLVQDIINEQLRMYGIEVYYLPRRSVTKGVVIRELLYSKFQNAFPIEAYLSTYEGFDNNSMLMSKFGLKITDEMSLIISKERFETYITQLIQVWPDFLNAQRPNEGDLIYIPLSDSLMEIKYVENRKPFYQLQKNYVYELKCELYEIEDDFISTGIPEVDYKLKDIGYSSTIKVSGLGITATASASLANGAIQKVDVINGGYRYQSIPALISDSPEIGETATFVGFMTSSRGLTSAKTLKKVYISNAGSGYESTNIPSVSIFGGGGYGASVNVGIATTGAVGIITVTYGGMGYIEPPTVTISSPGIGETATAEAFLDNNRVTSILITNAGYGYTVAPTVTIGSGSTIAIGNFIFGETVTGSLSNASGTVKYWDSSTLTLKVSGLTTNFIPGDIIVGSASTATYIVDDYDTYSVQDEYDDSEEIQEESDKILEFDELNPFGEV